MNIAVYSAAKKILGGLGILFVFFLFWEDSILMITLILLVALSIYFLFRTPLRETHLFDKEAIISTSDGIILSIEEMNSSENKGIIITIEQNLNDIGYLKSPLLQGVVKETKLVHGAFLSPKSIKKESLGESFVLFIQDKIDADRWIRIIHYPSWLSWLSSFHVQNGQLLNLSENYGFVKCGVTKVELPLDVRIAVGVGDSVYAGKTLLGYYTHKEKR